LIIPRNTFILVRLLEKQEEKIGNITVPGYNDLFCEGEILAVGPGTVSAAGGVSETFDLKVGQRVYVQHMRQAFGPTGRQNQLDGYRIVLDGEAVYLFEQINILAVLAEISTINIRPRDGTLKNFN